MSIHPAYLAGIIDGEGSIMLPRTGQNKLNDLYVSFSVKVAISNTDLNLLLRLQNDFGGIIERVRTGAKNCKDGYRLRWFSKDAVKIIGIVRPYLIVKAEQADLAASVFNVQQREGRRQRTLEQVMFFNETAAKIKALNKRGLD